LAAITAGQNTALNAKDERPAEIVRIDVPGATQTVPFGINARGDIVGQYNVNAPGSHGFLLQDGVYATIDFPGASGTTAAGINASGDIVGHYTSVSTGRASTYGFLLRNGVFTTLDVPGSAHTGSGAENFQGALGINSQGVVVGVYRTPDTVQHGYVWRDGVFITIDIPGAFETSATGINERGDIIGEFEYPPGGNPRSFLLTAGEWTEFRFPGARSTEVSGINSQGEMVGGYIGSDFRVHGFLFSKHGSMTIDIPGSTLTWANGINPRGDIVGRYVVASLQHGFLLKR
jgi:probable HAF family extracellular repeat protein